MILIPTHQSQNTNSPTILLFGGNPIRRDEVANLILQIAEVTMYAALSEEEGLEMLTNLSEIDLVLIGGRYSEKQRLNIRNFLKNKFPESKLTEPGWDYEYTNENIKADIKSKLNL